MDPLLVHAQALLGELTAALEGITGNTAQCWLLHMQVELVIHELLQLPLAAQALLGERGVLVSLHETLRAVSAFCGEFKGRHVLQRMLTYRGDAVRFDDFNRRLGEVARAAGFAPPLDEAAWREAQQSDIQTWDAMLLAVETSNTSTVNFGDFDALADQLAETCSIVENLRHIQSKQKNDTAPAGGSSGSFLQHVLAQQESWEINPREVKLDQVEDEFGNLRCVSLGEGAFGEVMRGRSFVGILFFLLAD